MAEQEDYKIRRKRLRILRLTVDQIIAAFKDQYMIPDDVTFLGSYHNIEDDTIRLKFQSDSFGYVPEGATIPWLKAEDELVNVIDATSQIICGQENCQNVATKKFNWPGDGWVPACPGCVVKAQGVATALGMDLVVQDL